MTRATETHKEEVVSVSEGMGVNSISFPLSELPASMNAIYQIVYNERRVELKPEVRRYKTKMKGEVPRWKVTDGSLVRMDLTFYSPDWYCKDGRVRRIDLPNLEKVVIDLICEKMGIDDSRVFEKWSRKVTQGKREGVDVRLVEIPTTGEPDGILTLPR